MKKKIISFLNKIDFTTKEGQLNMIKVFDKYDEYAKKFDDMMSKFDKTFSKIDNKNTRSVLDDPPYFDIPYFEVDGFVPKENKD